MRQRRALVMASNYLGTASELGGCIQDAQDWTVALADRGYAVQQLLGPHATAAAIQDGLRALVAATRYGDRAVVTWSGHGSWVPDRDGDEADQRDECILPDDYRARGVITDDQLYAIFGQRRLGARVVFVSDSCHSGTVTRLVPVVGTPRYVPPSAFLTGPALERARDLELREAPPSKPRQTAVLMAACAEGEVAYDAEFDGRPNGAFTRAALDVLSEPGSKTYAGWQESIRRRLPSIVYPQTPQLGASWWQRRWAVLD